MENPYIDGYIFGPNDLSGSYSMLGEFLSDKITRVMADAIEKLHKNGKYVAIASGGYSDEIMKHWSNFGVEMLSAGADFDFLRDGALNNRKNLEKIQKNYYEKTAGCEPCRSLFYSIIQISPPLPSLIMRPSVSDSFVRASSGMCSSLVWSPSFMSW